MSPKISKILYFYFSRNHGNDKIVELLAVASF